MSGLIYHLGEVAYWPHRDVLAGKPMSTSDESGHSFRLATLKTHGRCADQTFQKFLNRAGDKLVALRGGTKDKTHVARRGQSARRDRAFIA